MTVLYNYNRFFVKFCTVSFVFKDISGFVTLCYIWAFYGNVPIIYWTPDINKWIANM